MSMITPATPFICTEVDVAFDADLNDPAESWDWTTMGDYVDGQRTRPRVLNQTIGIVNGRRDESNLADPSTVEVLLGNGDLALTPRNPASPYWPGLRRGTPLRVMLRAGSPYLLLTGATGGRASTPDHASLDITGDLWMAVELAAPVRFPTTARYQLMAKYSAAGNQRSYYLAVTVTGLVVLFWSTNGTTVPPAATSTAAIVNPFTGPATIALHLDVDNGAGGHTCRFWSHHGTIAELRAGLDDDETQYRLGDPYVGAGPTSIHSGTAPLEIGDITGTGDDPYLGSVRSAEVRSGDWTGTLAANPAFTAQTDGAAGFTDTTGRPWTVTAPAGITNRRPRFFGRVDKATARWGEVDEENTLMPTNAYVTVSASGVLERLAQADAIGSALSRLVTAPINRDGVVAYWPHEDGSDATHLASPVAGVAAMSVQGSFSLASDSSLASSEPLVTVAAGDNAFFAADIPKIPDVAGLNWQVTRFFKIPAPAVSPAVTSFGATRTSGRVAKWTVTINDTQVAVVGVDDDGAGVVLATMSTDDRMLDTWAIAVLDVTDNGADVDWEVHIIPIPAGLDFSMSGSFTGATGVPASYRNSLNGPPEGISVGHVIVSTGRPVGWLAPADTAFVGEPAAQRVYRLCQEQEIPVLIDGPYGTDWSDVIAEGGRPMGPQRPGKLLDLLDECATVDFGVLGEKRDDHGLFFRSGVALRNQPTRLILERARRQVVEQFEEVDDDQRYANDVTASRPDGSSYRIEDPSIAAGTVERHERTVEANVESDLWLPDTAGWLYHLGTWEEPRFPQVWADVAKTADLADVALDFEVGDRFTVPDPPPGCPPVDQLADGIVEELERFQWRIGVNGHPAGPWDTGFYDDETLGRYDTAGSETTADFDAGTDTSLTVMTTLGQLWTTDTMDVPFEVTVGGVVLNVTGISGTSSPQTFTVDAAAVNGVVKTIPAGSDVRLAQPTIVAP